jgi:hypothetical protein
MLIFRNITLWRRHIVGWMNKARAKENGRRNWHSPCRVGALMDYALRGGCSDRTHRTFDVERIG